MTSRRHFLRQSTAIAGSLMAAPLWLSACGTEGRRGETPDNPPPAAVDTPAAPEALFLPEEGGSHLATWMAFPGSPDIWGRELAEVQEAVARVAEAIIQFEPVNMLVNPADLALAQSLVSPSVRLIPAALDDLWMRDTGPVFARDGDGDPVAIRFNFNGWGGKQTHAKDATVAATIAGLSGARLVTSRLVLEGGGLEWDGRGTVIATESCILNPNRNPGLSKVDCEQELARFGVRKVIWLPGIAGKDITDGHTDFYARFVRPGVVVAGLENDSELYDYEVTRKHLAILNSATDADGNRLEVHVLPGPDQVRQPDNPDFAAGYINFYLCNGGLVMPQFGDDSADAYARETLQALFPDRTVVTVDIDPIAAGGGGIHCTTQQQPS